MKNFQGSYDDRRFTQPNIIEADDTGKEEIVLETYNYSKILEDRDDSDSV